MMFTIPILTTAYVLVIYVLLALAQRLSQAS